MTEPDDAPPLPWSGQTYSAKRHGVSITSCDSEPVQTPGCIQPHGALLVLRRADLTILQASQNTERWLGQAAQSLLGKPVAGALGEHGRAAIEAHLRSDSSDVNPRYVFTLGRNDRSSLDVTVHTSGGVVVVELEVCARSETATERDPYSLLKDAVARLQLSRSLEEFSQLACGEVQRLTGFDRVMIYRFHEDLHGEVVAEAKLPSLDPLLGFHYPAEDIPAPAREVFKRTWIRPVPDVSGELIELVPLTSPDTGEALDMTQCALRGPSIMYTEYLRNMGVKAALTMSLRRGGALWGLIACHGYTGPVHLPFQVRAACELFAQVVSLQHRAAEERELVRYRQALDAVRARLVERTVEDGLPALTRGPPTLLDAVKASGAAVYDSGEWYTVGAVPGDDQLHALRTWLGELPQHERVFSTDRLPRVYPAGLELAAVASGVLCTWLARSHPSVLLWFRPETRGEVRWAGDPTDKPSVDGPHGPRLTPRRSFELFLESVTGRSEPWTNVERDSAERLRHDLLELAVVQAERLGRVNEELLRANQELARSNQELDAFAYVASHDLKEPLRGINKYAHQLLAEVPPEDLARRTKAESLVRLTLRMDTLIDSLLHFSRIGRVSLDFVRLPLDEVVGEALEMMDARRAENAVDIRISRPLPVVLGDRVQLREVFANLMANALKYNDKHHRWVEVGYLSPGEPGDRGVAPPSSANKTVLFVRDNGIGISAAHQAVVFGLFRRLHGRDAFGGGVGAGLTIVKKLVERHGGEIWLSSTLGEGTTFFFSLEGS